MKKESVKVLVIGFVILGVLIFVKQLFLPSGVLSFFASLVIALGIGFYLVKKIKLIEK
ncbi:MAG: hypothetical protein ACRCVG_06910 [Methanobacteriaceae archaeon]